MITPVWFSNAASTVSYNTTNGGLTSPTNFSFIVAGTNANLVITNYGGNSWGVIVNFNSDALLQAATNYANAVTNSTLIRNPWSSDVNAGGFNLTNLFKFGIGAAADTGSQNVSAIYGGTNSSGQVVLFRFRNTNSIWITEASVNGAAYSQIESLTSGSVLTVSSVVGTLLSINGGSVISGQANGLITISRSGVDFPGISFGGQNQSNGLIQFVSSSTGKSNGTFKVKTGNTNDYCNLEVGTTAFFGSVSAPSNTASFLSIANPVVSGLFYTNTTGQRLRLKINWILTDNAVSGFPSLCMTNVSTGEFYNPTNSFVLSGITSGRTQFEMSPGDYFIATNKSSGSATATVDASFATKE